MNQNAAVLFLLVSILVYSLFPLVGAYAVTKAHPVLFVACCHFSALAALTAVSTLVVRKHMPRFKEIKRLVLDRRFLVCACVSGCVNAASHASLFASFQFINSATAVMLYEIWPVAVIVIIQRLLPQKYTRLALRDWAFVAIALLGLVLLVQSEGVTQLTGSGSTLSVGVLLALASGLLMAISSGLDVYLTRRLDSLTTVHAQPILAQNVIKVFSSVGAFAAYFAFFRPEGGSVAIQGETLLLAAATGLFIVAVGAVTYHLGNLLSRSSAVNVLWYLTPALSLVWLRLVGLASLTAGIAFGAMLIITANLLLTVRAETRASYQWALAAMCLSAVYCYNVEGANNSLYYVMIAVVTGFFGILVSFILQRLARKAHELGTAAIDLLEGIAESESLTSGEKTDFVRNVLDFLDARIKPRDPKLRIRDLEKLRGRDKKVDSWMRKLRLASVAVVSFGEVYVLWALAGLGLLITHVDRPESFIGDLMPVVLTAVFVFLCILVTDERGWHPSGLLRSMYGHHAQLIPRITTASAESQDITSQAEWVHPLLSAVFLIVFFLIYAVMLYAKHNVALPTG